jgi:hypothetical protein
MLLARALGEQYFDFEAVEAVLISLPSPGLLGRGRLAY